MEPRENRLCGRECEPIHSISNIIPHTYLKVKRYEEVTEVLEMTPKHYSYIIRGSVNKKEYPQRIDLRGLIFIGY